MRRARQRPLGWAATIGGVLAAAGGVVVLRRRPAARTALQKAVPELAARVPGFAARVKSVRKDDVSPSETTGQPSDQEATAPSQDGGEQASHRQPWQCECGQDYLVAGQDRHQIYWLDGAEENGPVLSDHCPNCDRRLPAVSRANAAD